MKRLAAASKRRPPKSSARATRMSSCATSNTAANYSSRTVRTTSICAGCFATCSRASASAGTSSSIGLRRQTGSSRRVPRAAPRTPTAGAAAGHQQGKSPLARRRRTPPTARAKTHRRRVRRVRRARVPARRSRARSTRTRRGADANPGRGMGHAKLTIAAKTRRAGRRRAPVAMSRRRRLTRGSQRKNRRSVHRVDVRQLRVGRHPGQSSGVR
mmetsp:Transcript_111960/g.321702  ORF Transcript_111960/g.321702 Transcript_111960/m.321702 type:complete len:214 (-) Transcript_111960:232-873(-)